MSEVRRNSAAAVVLLVVLRLAIGWHLLYEGLWKINTLSTATPWTSAGYLKNSAGPMRDTFRSMAGDPNDLDWLNYDTVSARWDDWAARFRSHYQLTDNQAGSLYRLIEGSHTKVGKRLAFGEPLEKLDVKLNVGDSVIWYDESAKQLYVDADKPLQPGEKQRLEGLVKSRTDADAAAFRTALERLYDKQKKGMGYRRKLLGALGGDPEVVGDEGAQLVGKAAQYRTMLAEYETDRSRASTSFQWDHLNHTWGEIQTLRSELVGPIRAMEAELHEKAQEILTTDQLSAGPVPEPWTPLRITDVLTIAGLTILGALLILGLFTRLSAVVAAFMLFNFYLAMPPWPGVPEPPGTEHSFIINKNLIEVFALLGIAALPTGRWFGLDRLVSYCWGRCCGKKKSTANSAS
ncbi:MAG: hypothetical protein R3C19_04795 [Planctomycetaceae bacterium]